MEIAATGMGSTVPRRQLGRSLREARSAAGFTVRAAAKVLEWSEPKIWRIETGQVSMRSLDVEAMCRMYGVAPDLTEALMGLAKETKARGWWHAYGDAVPDWFDVYVGLEGAARDLRMYESEMVPGLFQTAAYARHVMTTAGALSPEEIERRVLVRMQRQSIVTRPVDPTSIEALIGEAVLRRPVGDRALMAAQCRHLADLSERPNVKLRVVPFDSGWHIGCTTGPFVILRFPMAGDGREIEPPTVYAEGYTGALYLDRPAEVKAFDAVFTSVTTTIDDDRGARSRKLLHDAAREYGR
jgi:transcriptional regulator with XRE-family HTH domain